jgi:hypothetical protein
VANDAAGATRSLCDAIADPGSAVAASSAAAASAAAAASLISMALDKSRKLPIEYASRARALRRSCEGRVDQAAMSFAAARSAIEHNEDHPATADLDISGTLPILEGIAESAEGVLALAEEVQPGLERNIQPDVMAAAFLAAGAGDCAAALACVNRVQPAAGRPSLMPRAHALRTVLAP